jgi:hypothetical protein
MPPQYEDFFLIVNGAPGDYAVEAHAPGEIRIRPVPFEYRETDELRVELNSIKEGFAPSRQRMQLVGSLLFEALFPRKIIRAFEGAPRALSDGVKLRLKLIVRPPELSHLPWELMYDPDEEIFLAARLSYPIVRFVESGTPVASLLARRPLRMLYVQANPSDTTPLDAAASEKALKGALGTDAEIAVVHSTTPSALRDMLRESPGFHILHYDGHGDFDEQSDAGHLYLHDEEGESYPLSGEMLATYLDGSSVRLVVLSACETAVDSKQKRLSGIAQQLMRASSLPAMVAMQFAIPDDSAIAFIQGFYQALADDYPVDAATIEGRKAILEILGGDAGAFAAPDWATPVLFMRVKDGDILREEIKADRVGEAKERHVDTGGGAYIGGSVDTGGGDFVGRDKIVHGDEVHGDKVLGDKVGGDKITVGDISRSTGVAIGRGAQATVTQGLGGDEIARLFAEVYQQIKTRSEDPDVDKEELTETVQKIQGEVARGEEANPHKVERWLKTLAGMADDIFEVTVACLTSPAAGVATVIRKVAQKAKEEAA